MTCDICERVDGHISGCPNCVPAKASLYCSYCDEGINEWDEYIENEDGELIHRECIQGISQLLDWLGVEIKTMEDTNCGRKTP